MMFVEPLIRPAKYREKFTLILKRKEDLPLAQNFNG
jgi:hypothetical protein